MITDLNSTLPKSAGEAVDQLRERFGATVLSSSEFRGEHTVVVPREFVLGVCNFCRNDLAFDYLVDVSTVDNSGTDPRFEAVYHLYSYSTNLHLRIKAAIPEDDASITSVSSIWKTANWHEREAYDMMGVNFDKHPDLRRILMWEGYPFFPLRKEFPLAGKPSEMPDVASTGVAPLEGGPFVTSPGAGDTVRAEPRSKE